MNKKSQSRPLVLGLTGSIGMGKSTVAKNFKDLGVPVYNADKAIHALMAKNGEAVEPIATLFPSVLKKGAIDRKALGEIVFKNAALLKRLENILHPRILKAEKEVIDQAHKDGKKAVLLEIPLLFETGAHKRCDLVFCVSAPSSVQQKRVLKRKDMTIKKMRDILSHQLPDAIKRKKANFVIDTGTSLAETKATVKKLYALILEELNKNA